MCHLLINIAYLTCITYHNCAFCFKVTLAGRVRPNSYYYIAVHYKQAKDLSIDAELTMTLSSKPITLSQQFAFCPADAGCRVLLGEGKGGAFFVNIQRPTIEIKTSSSFTVVS